MARHYLADVRASSSLQIPSPEPSSSKPFSPAEDAALILDDATLAYLIRNAGVDRVKMIAAAVEAQKI
jgi:hypothetical protein